MWDQGRSMDKMSSQTSFPLKHSMIRWWSMDCPLPINIQLNSSPVYILGDSEECGCSFCLLQLIVSRLCPGDSIRELTGMGNRLLLTERNSQTTSPTFLSDSCRQPPPPTPVPSRSVGWEPCHIWNNCSWNKISILIPRTHLLQSTALDHSLACALSITLRCSQWWAEDGNKGSGLGLPASPGEIWSQSVAHLRFLHLP